MTAHRYGCIIMDPPWRYRNNGGNGAAEVQYPTMSVAELCALPVGQLAADDCVLLLWATAPCLQDAFALIVAYGFAYVTKIPWIKLAGDPARTLWGDWTYRPQYGTGFWGRGCAEDVLVCRRGNPKPPVEAASSLLLLSENFGHSRKPENLYEYAEHFPGPWLEMFARRSRARWDSYGNEVLSTIAMQAT